jgi:hypothetical protein
MTYPEQLSLLFYVIGVAISNFHFPPYNIMIYLKNADTPFVTNSAPKKKGPSMLSYPEQLSLLFYVIGVAISNFHFPPYK